MEDLPAKQVLSELEHLNAEVVRLRGLTSPLWVAQVRLMKARTVLIEEMIDGLGKLADTLEARRACQLFTGIDNAVMMLESQLERIRAMLLKEKVEA